MAKKSVSQVSKEVNGKKVRELETKGGNIIVHFADGTELVLSSEKPITVEYGETDDAEPVAKQGQPLKPY